MASTLPALIHHVKQRDDTTLERSCLLSQVDSYLTPQEDHAVVSAIISALPALLKVLSEHTMMAPKAVCGSAQTGTRMVTRRMSMEMEAAPTLSTTATTGANVDHGHRLLSKLADIIKRSGPKWRVRLSIAENLPAISKSAAASTTADTSTPATDSHITPLIAALCRDQVSDVRQAAVALLAEMRPWTSAISSVVCALAHESTYTHRLQFVKVCRAVMMASVSCEGEESSSEMTALRSELRALEARETVRVVREAIMAMPAALSMNASTCVQ